jgi:hypothetical protein
VPRPDTLAGKSLAEIAALPVQHGNAPAALREFLKIEGDAGDLVALGKGEVLHWCGF